MSIMLQSEDVEQRVSQLQSLVRITERINAGMTLEEVLDHLYGSFQELVPYDRIGCALIGDDRLVHARWARSAATERRLDVGYSAPLEGSSLSQIIASGEPRILNDLPAYLREHPDSRSTQLIVEEGMRASLTCGLVAMGEPIGFLFFSSCTPHAYRAEHVALLQEVAGQLALIVEKSRLYGQLVELNAQKSLLLGMAAHDLRGPIAVIQGFIEILQQGLVGPTTDRQREVFGSVRRTCQGMLRLIDNFLDVSAIEAGRVELQPREVDLPRFFEECHLTQSLLAEAKSIRLETSLERGLERACFDPERLSQVISNLVGNAIKYSQPGTCIRLLGRRAGLALEIVVADQGQGIPGEELPRLFTAFGRGAVRPTAGERSIGLGLAIVKRMVEAHGGSVLVESRVGEGTAFHIAFPLAAPADTGGIL